jgi:hypothetical protein
MKNFICEKDGLELLRIESQHLAPGPRGRRLLEYLIDARAYCQNIYDLQQEGSLPWDELFDYGGVVGGISDGYLDYVNDLAGPARNAVRNAYRLGRLAEDLVHPLWFDWRDGWSEDWAWVKVRDDLFLFATTRLRSYPMFFCGISPGELAADLSAVAVGEQLAALGRGEPVLMKASDIGEKFAQVRARRNELKDAGFLDRGTWGGRRGHLSQERGSVAKRDLWGSLRTRA